MIGDLIVIGLEIYLIFNQWHSPVRLLQMYPSLQFHTPQRPYPDDLEKTVYMLYLCTYVYILRMCVGMCVYVNVYMHICM